MFHEIIMSAAWVTIGLSSGVIATMYFAVFPLEKRLREARENQLKQMLSSTSLIKTVLEFVEKTESNELIISPIQITREQ